MKITPAKIAAFLRHPEVSSVLVYGPDRGLAHERAQALILTAVDDLSDPFRVTVLKGSAVVNDPAIFRDEAAALSLTGGRRAVLVEGATDAVTKTLKVYLADDSGDTLIVVEAGELGPRSTLRQLFEKSANAAALACYADNDGSLERLIVDTLGGHRLRAEPDAIAYLKANLGSDRMVSRSELEKLALYKGDAGPVSLKDAQACVGDSAAVSLDAVVYAAAGGDQQGLDRALCRVLEEGGNPVSVLRAVSRHLQRLHLSAAMVAQGRSPDQAMKSLRPPVIFLFQDRFRTQLRLWSLRRLAAAMDLIVEAELDCKTTGMPAESLCGRALMRMTQAARAH